MGEHKGTHNFTIGQRKGINISYKEPLYVTSIDPDMRIVYVGPKGATEAGIDCLFHQLDARGTTCGAI